MADKARRLVEDALAKASDDHVVALVDIWRSTHPEGARVGETRYYLGTVMEGRAL